MKIIKPGDLSRIKKIKRFECPKCGCVFEADKEEYQHHASWRNIDVYACKCPTCDGKCYLEE